MGVGSDSSESRCVNNQLTGGLRMTEKNFEYDVRAIHLQESNEVTN